MIFLINLLFALGFGALAAYLLREAGVTNPVRIIIAVLVGIVVFILNLARYVTT